MKEEEVFDQLELAEIKTKFDRRLDSLGKKVSWLIFISMIITLYEVFMRYILHSPTKWVHETTVLLVAVFFALGGVIALARGKHIRVRMIYDACGEVGKRRIDLGIAVLSTMYFAVLSYAAYLTFLKSVIGPDGALYLVRSGSAWNPPFPPLIRLAILVATVIMCAQSAWHIAYMLKKNTNVTTDTATTDANSGNDTNGIKDIKE